MSEVVILGEVDVPGADESQASTETSASFARRLLLGIVAVVALGGVGTWLAGVIWPEPPFEPPEAVLARENAAVMYIRQDDGSFGRVELPGNPADFARTHELADGWLVPVDGSPGTSLFVVPYDGGEAWEFAQASSFSPQQPHYWVGDDQVMIARPGVVEVYDLELRQRATIDLVGQFEGFSGDGSATIEIVDYDEVILRSTDDGHELVRFDRGPTYLDQAVVAAEGVAAWIEPKPDDDGNDSFVVTFLGLDGSEREIAWFGESDSDLLVQLLGTESVLMTQIDTSMSDDLSGDITATVWSLDAGLQTVGAVSSVVAVPTEKGFLSILADGSHNRMVEVARDGSIADTATLASANGFGYTFRLLDSHGDPSNVVGFNSWSGGDGIELVDLESGRSIAAADNLFPVGVSQRGLVAVRFGDGSWPGPGSPDEVDVVVLDLETGESVELATGVDQQYVVVNGNGVYFTYADPEDRPGLWRVDAAGGEPEQVSETATPSVWFLPQMGFAPVHIAQTSLR